MLKTILWFEIWVFSNEVEYYIILSVKNLFEVYIKKWKGKKVPWKFWSYGQSPSWSHRKFSFIFAYSVDISSYQYNNIKSSFDILNLMFCFYGGMHTIVYIFAIFVQYTKC